MDRTDEEILSYEVTDEALEATGNSAPLAGKYSWCGGGPCFHSAPGEAKLFNGIDGWEVRPGY